MHKNTTNILLHSKNTTTTRLDKMPTDFLKKNLLYDKTITIENHNTNIKISTLKEQKVKAILTPITKYLSNQGHMSTNKK